MFMLKDKRLPTLIIPFLSSLFLFGLLLCECCWAVGYHLFFFFYGSLIFFPFSLLIMYLLFCFYCPFYGCFCCLLCRYFCCPLMGISILTILDMKLTEIFRFILKRDVCILQIAILFVLVPNRCLDIDSLRTTNKVIDYWSIQNIECIYFFIKFVFDISFSICKCR